MKTSMRYLAVIFAVAMLVLTLISVSADSFTDISGETPHYKAIDTLTSYGIIHGYEDNTFRPDLPVRRDEMAKLVYVTATTSVDAGEGVVTFPDVAKNSWAKGYISWCAGMNIVGGYEDGSFKPEGNVTYDEALKMVCAMLGYTDFKSELWPTDVRIKALIDLNLGEGLDGVAGDAALTRGQVAQLFANSLDEQMYIAPVEQKPGQPVQTVNTPSTLAGDVWGYTQTFAQIVATENWGLKIPVAVAEGEMSKTTTWENYGTTHNIIDPQYIEYAAFTKTGKDDAVTVRFLDANGDVIIENGVEKIETLSLKDVNLTAYEGKTDELLAYQIAIMIDKKGEYLSASLKGSTLKAAPFSSGSKTYGIGKGEGEGEYACSSIKVDGIEYVGENFNNLRRLVFLQDGSGTALLQPMAVSSGKYLVDSEGKIYNRIHYTYSYQTNAPNKSDPSTIYAAQNFGWLLVSGGAQGPKNAIDADGDGYYDYVIISPKTSYEVVNVTKKNITLRGIYSAYGTSTYASPVPYEHTYSLENYNALVIPEKGDVIVGYFVGEQFYCEDTVQKITAFATKKAGSTVSLYGYGAYTASSDSFAPGYLQAGPILNKVVDAINTNSTFIGIDPNTNDYVYCNYYIYEGKIIYCNRASEADTAGETDAQDKAILLYVDKPTEPQINEKTKKYEVFYPAYLLINGKEELVNLKATNAINGAEAEMVAQDGSMYRAFVKDGIVMYRNLLVTFEVDDDGYYSLKTSIGDNDVEKDGKVVGKVIAANEVDALGMIVANKGYKLTIDPATQLMSIVDSSDNVVLNKIVTKNSSVIYYPYTKKTTGAHEHIDFYYGNEVPAEFEAKEIIGDVYLALNSEGLWEINTMMIGLDGFNAVSATTADDYKKDARLHLLALAEKEAEYSEVKNDVFAAYSFKGIYEETDVTKTNEEKDYSDSLAVTVNGIYAWDDKEDNYVEIDTALASYSVETIEEVLAEMGLVYTNASSEGYILNEGVKILAIKDVPDNAEEEFLMEYITIDDLAALLETIATYNDEESASETLSARIGTYVDENKKTQVAYIIVYWVEFNDELGEYTFAGETK